MHIGLVHQYSWPDRRGVTERYLHVIADHLAQRGHATTLVVGPSRFPIPTAGRVIVVGRKGRSTRSRLSMVAALVRHRFDVVLTFTPLLTVAAAVAGQRVVHVETGRHAPGDPSNRRANTLWRLIGRSADAMITIGATELPAGPTPPAHHVPTLALPVTTEHSALTAEENAGQRVVLGLHAPGPRDDARRDADGMTQLLRGLVAARPRWSELVLQVPADLGRGIASEEMDGLPVVTEHVVLEPRPTAGPTGRVHGAVVLPGWDQAALILDSFAAGLPVLTAATPAAAIVTSEIGRVVQLDDPQAVADGLLDMRGLAGDPAVSRACLAVAERHQAEPHMPELDAFLARLQRGPSRA